MKILIALILLLTLPALGNPSREFVSIDVHDVLLTDVLSMLGAQSGANIVADSSVRDVHVTFRLARVTLDEALSVLCASEDLTTHRIGKTILVGSAGAMRRRFGDGVTADNSSAAIAVPYGDVLDTAKALQNALPATATIIPDKTGHRIFVTGGSSVVLRARQLIAAMGGSTSQGESGFHAYRLRYSRAADMAAALKTALPDAIIVSDEAQNAVVAKGGSETQSQVRGFIAQLDVPSSQVLFEVRVADVRPVNEQSDVGILLGGYDLSGQAVAGAATYAFARNALAINARLNALITSGHAQILATPRLLTLNNHEADLLIGETYPVTYFDTRVGGQQVQFVDIGVKLRLTPTIGSDGSVTAEMHPEYSAIEGFVGGYPVLTSRKVDSKLRVNDGQTIVLGGLIRDIDTESLSRIPGLSSIPFFGKLFEDRQKTRQRDEVVFLITPHVLVAPSR